MFKYELRRYLKSLGARVTYAFEHASEHELLANLNGYVDDSMFSYEFKSDYINSIDDLPKSFFFKKNGNILFCEVVDRGIFVGKKDIVEDIFISNETIEIFYIHRMVLKRSGREFLSSLSKFGPKYSFFSIFLVAFSLLSPFYVNLFNRNLIYNDSLISVLYVTALFIILLGFEIFFKLAYSNYVLAKLKVSSEKVSSYLSIILSRTKIKNIATKIRMLESSSYGLVENINHIIPDVLLSAVFYFTLTLMIGKYSIILSLFYFVFFVLMIIVRFEFYKKMLKSFPISSERINRLISFEMVNNNVLFLNTFRFNEFTLLKNEEDEHNKLYFSKHNFIWGELGKAGGFLATVVLLIVCYISVHNDILQTASIMGLLIVNSRLYSSLTSLVARIYQILVYKDQIVKYVDNINDSFFEETGNLAIARITNYKAERLSLKFDGVCIFDNINFNLKGGDLVGIFGRVGSGKSSLLFTLSNIEKKYHGSIFVNDVDIKNLSNCYIRSQVSYYGPDTNFISGTLRDNFLFYGVNNDDDIVRILRFSCPRLPTTYEVLEITPVTELPLSNGEKQKLLLLMILHKKPSLIFLDEPTSFLSQVEGEAIVKFIRLTNPTSIVFIATHDVGLRTSFTHVIDMD
ncbi:ATP-binding cassette domain-containing protein [Vibrio fluvialis]|nr:ATP-binding cassette domain-containing protein [Vibrio fluvialis]